MVTGAFHEDGLADMADGFGAGGSPEKIDRIMHDSRLGTYGTTALILGFLIRLGLVMSLAELGYSIMIILAFGFATGKLSVILLRSFANSSIFSKTGSIIEKVSVKNLIIATVIWFVPIALVFPFIGILFGIFLALAVLVLISEISKQKIGGLTGDVLGATAFLTELVFLFGLTISLRLGF